MYEMIHRKIDETRPPCFLQEHYARMLDETPPRGRGDIYFAKNVALVDRTLGGDTLRGDTPGGYMSAGDTPVEDMSGVNISGGDTPEGNRSNLFDVVIGHTLLGYRRSFSGVDALHDLEVMVAIKLSRIPIRHSPFLCLPENALVDQNDLNHHKWASFERINEFYVLSRGQISVYTHNGDTWTPSKPAIISAIPQKEGEYLEYLRGEIVHKLEITLH